MQVLLSTLWNWHRQLRTFLQLRLVRQHWLSELPTNDPKSEVIHFDGHPWLLFTGPAIPNLPNCSSRQYRTTFPPSHKSQPFSRHFHENLDAWLHTVHLHHNAIHLKAHQSSSMSSSLESPSVSLRRDNAAISPLTHTPCEIAHMRGLRLSHAHPICCALHFREFRRG